MSDMVTAGLDKAGTEAAAIVAEQSEQAKHGSKVAGLFTPKEGKMAKADIDLITRTATIIAADPEKYGGKADANFGHLAAKVLVEEAGGTPKSGKPLVEQAGKAAKLTPEQAEVMFDSTKWPGWLQYRLGNRSKPRGLVNVTRRALLSMAHEMDDKVSDGRSRIAGEPKRIVAANKRRNGSDKGKGKGKGAKASAKKGSAKKAAPRKSRKSLSMEDAVAQANPASKVMAGEPVAA